MSREHLPVYAFALLLFACLFEIPSASAKLATIGTNFEGTSLSESGFRPPDSMGAVGPNHIVELINGTFAIYDRSGTLQGSRISLTSFWSTTFSNTSDSSDSVRGSFAFDPRLLYDPHSERWYATAVDNSRADNQVLVGVTTGSDPSIENWRGFAVDSDSAGTRWADFPTVGLDSVGFYIASNMFDISPSSSPILATTVTLIGVPKADLIAADIAAAKGATRVEENIGQLEVGFAVQPVVDLDNGSGALASLAIFPGNRLKLNTIPADWITGNSDLAGSFAVEDLIGDPVTPPVDADQPGSSVDIEVNDARFSGNTVLNNGRLWAVHHVLDNDSGLDSIRWYEIDPEAQGNDAILQSGLITLEDTHLYFPSIAVNDLGDVVIGFSGSGLDTPVSSFAAVGETVDGTTTFSSPFVLYQGDGSYEQVVSGRNRWGDYSATVLDPLDPLSFWTFQEYVSSEDEWSLRITQITLESATVPISFAAMLILMLMLMGVGRHRLALRK